MKTISSGIVGFSINYHSWRRFVIQLMKPHSRTRFIMNYPLIIMKYTYTLENTLENPLRIADESLNTFVLGSRWRLWGHPGAQCESCLMECEAQCRCRGTFDGFERCWDGPIGVVDNQIDCLVMSVMSFLVLRDLIMTQWLMSTL